MVTVKYVRDVNDRGYSRSVSTRVQLNTVGKLFNILSSVAYGQDVDVIFQKEAYHFVCGGSGIETGLYSYLEGVSEEYDLEEAMLDYLTWNPSKYERLAMANDRRDAELVSARKGSEMVLQYHGLAAYSGKSDFTAKLEACLSEDFVICGSDRAIGPVGIVFEGPVYKAFAMDVWSNAEDRNAVDRTKTVAEKEFLSLSAALVGKKNYIETFTQVDWVFHMWCDPSLPAHILEEVKACAVHFGLEVKYEMPKRLGKGV